MNTIEASTAPGILREGCALLVRGARAVLMEADDRPEKDRAGPWTVMGLEASFWESWHEAFECYGLAMSTKTEDILIDCDRPAGRDCVVRYLAEQGLDYSWARDIPGALVEGVRRFVAGDSQPLLGVVPYVWSGRHLWTKGLFICFANDRGWELSFDGRVGAYGPETGEEGKALAEAAVRQRYWVTP